jgi:hypothetical protein
MYFLFLYRFFEWKRSKEGKQPYFIYFPQDSDGDKKHDSKPTLPPHVKTDPDSKDFKLKAEHPEKSEHKVKSEQAVKMCLQSNLS